MDQNLEVYKVDGKGNFVDLAEEDVADLEFGPACDDNGEPLEIDDFPELDGKKVLCVNWLTFEGGIIE